MDHYDGTVDIPMDFDAITALADLHTALDKERATSILASVAMGLDALKSMLLMGASINKVMSNGTDFVDEQRRT